MSKQEIRVKAMNTEENAFVEEMKRNYPVEIVKRSDGAYMVGDYFYVSEKASGVYLFATTEKGVIKRTLRSKRRAGRI